MEHTKWFDRVTGGDSVRQVGLEAGVSNRTIAHQLKKGELSAEVIIKVAQAYGVNPLAALVDLGFAEAKWLIETSAKSALMGATDEELTDELLRRLKLLDSRPVDEVAEERSNGASITRMPGPRALGGEVFDYELAAADGAPDEENWGDDHDFIP